MKTADTIAWYLSLAFLIAAVAHAAYVFCLDSSTMDKPRQDSSSSLESPTQ